jgi:hypothetical protein
MMYRPSDYLIFMYNVLLSVGKHFFCKINDGVLLKIKTKAQHPICEGIPIEPSLTPS